MLNQQLSPELRLLIRAALDKSAQAEEEAYSNLNWSRLSKLAKWHQVRPMLFEYMQERSLQVPAEQYEALKEFSFGQAITNMAFLGISTRLLSELNQAGISVFPMKGALWAWMLYAKPTLREFGDIDYFIEKSDVQKSLAVLQKNGFAPDAYRSFLFSVRNGADAYLSTDYQLPLTPIEENALQSLEIQWNCSYPRYYFDFGYKDLMQNAVTLKIGNYSLQVPSPENQLLMMIIHHAGVEQWDKLKYAGDFIRLLDKYADQIDWHYVKKQAASRGFVKLVGHSLALATSLTGNNYIRHFDAPALSLNDPFIHEVLEHWENGRPPLKTKSWSIFRYNLKHRDDIATKAIICVRHLQYLFQWRLLWHKYHWYRKR